MKLKLILLAAALLLLATPIFAQAPGTPVVASGEWKFALAAIGMGIASGLCGIGQGKAVAGASEAMARNPGATAAIRGALILGLVLIESLALYTLVIIYTVGPVK
ncbi:MAG: ATP synthase F0 subunit C [Acidobacteriota bacterium]|jgi:F-type H+-transporting ATPase subunit c|nr:ATP synthase F0 subunit C [Acidobacteriota bacterium]